MRAWGEAGAGEGGGLHRARDCAHDHHCLQGGTGGLWCHIGQSDARPRSTADADRRQRRVAAV